MTMQNIVPRYNIYDLEIGILPSFVSCQPKLFAHTETVEGRESDPKKDVQKTWECAVFFFRSEEKVKLEVKDCAGDPWRRSVQVTFNRDKEVVFGG